MRNTSIWIVFYLVLAWFVGAAPGAYGQDWQPNPKDVAKLAPSTAGDGFAIRPPPNLLLHKMSQTVGPMQMQVYYWHRPNTQALFGGLAVNVYGIALPQTPEQAASDWIDKTVSKNIDPANITQSDVESGTIDGIPFARIYYKGPLRQSGQMAHGFVYVGITGDRTYIMESVDLEPTSSKSLSLAEAAVMTFHET